MSLVLDSLPATIRVLSVQPAPADFHSRGWNLGKRYVYTVQEGLGCPFSARYRWALGRGKVLDLGRMTEAAALLLGEHDLSLTPTLTTDPNPNPILDPDPNPNPSP